MTPPLPIQDGVLQADNGLTEAIQKCPRKAWMKYVLRRVSAQRSDALAFGKALHAAWETRYKVCGSKAPTDEQKFQLEAVLDKHFEGVPDSDDHRNIGRAKEVLGYYNEQYGDEPYETLATEIGIERELGTIRCPHCHGMPIVWEAGNKVIPCPVCTRVGLGGIRVNYIGRLDGIVRYEGKALVRDFKTSQQLRLETEDVKWRMNGQMRGYNFLASKPELGFGEVRGFWIDQAIVRKPTVKKSAIPRNEFHRAQYSVTDTEIEEWKRDTLAILEGWLGQCAQATPPPMYRASCSMPAKCEFFDTCSLATEEQRMMWLNSAAYAPNEFNPLQKDSDTNS